MKYIILSLLLVSGPAFAHGSDDSPTTTTTTTSSSTPLVLPSQSTYGLLGLAANNQFDWGVPDKVQLGVTMAFTEGGNQAVAVGAATRLGGILMHGQFVTVIDGPDSADDYAIIVGGTMRF